MTPPDLFRDQNLDHYLTKLILNFKKYIIFKPKGTNITLNDDEGIFFGNNDDQNWDPQKVTKLDREYNDNPVVQDRSYKLLGIYLDEQLSFDIHCKYVCSKIASSNYFMNRSKHFRPSKSLRTLYFSLEHSNLLYCLPVYSCTSQKNLNKLYLTQKKLYVQ
jgi:hypothetical protein